VLGCVRRRYVCEGDDTFVFSIFPIAGGHTDEPLLLPVPVRTIVHSAAAPPVLLLLLLLCSRRLPCSYAAGGGIEVLFPVQAVVWQQTAGGASTAHDVCICAPTGSGKTLAYTLPVLQALAQRAAPCLRALIVLPTRDLAAQVFGVLAALCPPLGLSAALACGRASLAAEAELLSGGGIGAPLGCRLPPHITRCWLCAIH
jgi:ATP-dependent RNA helicase DDX51/DBP6